MQLLPLDFETFWSDTHSLSKMNPIDYVLHPDTQIISVGAVPPGETKAQCVFGEKNIKAFLRECGIEKSLAIAHNMSGFDAMILAWRLELIPRMWGCTLAMARPLHAKTTGLSLAALVKHYGIGEKDATVLHDTKGKRLEDFTPDELTRMSVYNADGDTVQCGQLFNKLLPNFSAQELWAIHWSIRMLVQPEFELDMGLLETALSVERANKHKSLLELAHKLDKPEGIAWDDERALTSWLKKDLSSSAKFVALLQRLGVDVPMKASPSDPAKQIPAVSKTDQAMEDLCEHEDEIVAAAARERLSVKSTIVETRLTHFLNVGKVTKGKWPVTTHYSGADTTMRRSGWLYNPLNLNRINPSAPKTSDALRRSIRAPKGKKIVVCDLSGIEMRFNHFLWRVPYSCEMWTADREADLYRASAARSNNILPEQVTKAQRQAAKVENLGLGFGMGPAKFVFSARVMSGGDLNYTLEEAEARVRSWRTQHIEIVKGWRTCHAALEDIMAGRERAIDPGEMFITCKEGIRRPTGNIIRYPGLHVEYDKDTGKEEFWYGQGRHRSRIYAGKITENIVQAGARDGMYEMLYDVYRQTKRYPNLEVYDEGAWCVPDDEAEEFLKLVEARFREGISWFPMLVTNCEGDIADNYGDAK